MADMVNEPERLDLLSYDIAEANRQELLRLFPEIRTEGGKIDFDRLKLVLGEMVDTGRERYGLNWPGKASCFHTTEAPSLGTLRPCPEESIEFDTTENLIIEGDNLEVLKLLQKSYIAKVRMIYIDPPYNTGKNFIYPDDYTESLQVYLEYTGQVDGNGRKFSTNTDSDGRFHSKWLNMMYPRLYLARNLLSEDGIMFVSIDDHEAANLRKICEDIFGEENILAQLCWRTDGNFDNQAKFKECHEYILVVAKDADKVPHPPVVDPSTPPDSKVFLPEIRNTIVKNGPKNPQSEILLPVGFPCELREGEVGPRVDSWPQYLDRAEIKDGRLAEPVTVKSGWQSKDLLLAFIRNGFEPIKDGKGQETRFIITATGGIDGIKSRSHQSHVITVLTGLGGPQKASTEMGELGVPFDDYPKPTSLIKYFLQMVEGDDFIVLDFFAGSGTTAHAVLELNAEDKGNRRFILVQLPEPTKREDYPTIAEICKERVRRVVKKLKAEDVGKLDLNCSGEQDRGFRVFKLAESNFVPWDANAPKDTHQLVQQLTLHIDHLRQGRSAEDLLYELLLKSGKPLTTPISSEKLGGKTVYSVDDGAFLICLEPNVTLELIRAIAEKKPKRVICLDQGFVGNDQLKANAVQMFRAKGITSFNTI